MTNIHNTNFLHGQVLAIIPQQGGPHGPQKWLGPGPWTAQKVMPTEAPKLTLLQMCF